MTDRHSHLQDEFLASSTNETTVNNTNNNPTQQQLPLGKTSVTVPVTGGNSTTSTSGNASTGTGGHLMGIGNNVLLQQPIQQLSQLQSQQGQGQMSQSQSQSQSQSLSQQQTQQQGNATNIITSNALSTPHSNASNLQLQQQIHLQQQQLHQQQIQLHNFWQGQINQIRQINPDTTDFKTHQLPLARIKKIMKTDEDVRMISAEAPVLFAKACELFILELSLRSWIHTEENKRRTLQRNDIATAVTKTDMFDFLIDIVPREDLKAAQSMSAAAVTALSFNPMAVGLAGPDGSIIKQEHDGKTEGMSAENANEMANIYQQQLQQQQAALQHMMQQSQNEGGNPQQWQNQQFGQQYQQLQQVIDSQQQHQQQQSQNNGQHSDNSKNNNDASGANEQPTIEV